MNELPIEISSLLDEFTNVIVDELPNALPHVRSIKHHIYLIPGSNLPNKVAYQMTSNENEEIGSQVRDLLDEELIREILSPYVVPVVLSPNKDGG